MRRCLSPYKNGGGCSYKENPPLALRTCIHNLNSPFGRGVFGCEYRFLFGYQARGWAFAYTSRSF